MKAKRIISIILTMILLSCLMAACGQDNNGSGGDNAGSGSNNTDSGNSGDNNTAAGGGNGNPDSSGNSNDSINESPGGGENSTNAGSESGSSGDNSDGKEPGGDGVGSSLTGTPAEILEKLIEDLTAAGVEMPMSIPPMEVQPDMSQNTIGLSEDDFNKYVKDSAYTMAAIGTFPHQIILVQAVDEKAAGEIKKIVTGDNGYDAKKWICVFPERAVAVESGVYLLIVVSKEIVTDAAVEAFRNNAGSIGEADTFWEFTGEAAAGGGGLALG